MAYYENQIVFYCNNAYIYTNCAVLLKDYYVKLRTNEEMLKEMMMMMIDEEKKKREVPSRYYSLLMLLFFALYT